jgi:hypothetical protein
LGAPVFAGDEAVAEGVGISVALGVAVGCGDGVSSGVGDGEGDAVGFGVGEDFLCFVFGVALGEGVGDVFLCFGDEVGEGVGVCFGLALERFRCFRTGVGVGVEKNLFIFSPNDSSAARVSTVPQEANVTKRKRRSAAFNFDKPKITAPAPEEPLCLNASRLPSFRVGNSR